MLGGSDALSSILWSRLRCVRDERLKMDRGIAPESMLPPRIKYSKLFLSRPSSLGMILLTSFLVNTRMRGAVRPVRGTGQTGRRVE